ncbi:HNH endonuclease signature motif containing protein [Mycobacterium sp. NS-7484]|uniref:HNH endonuclease signature motif containing protein n=1 Tax=Mycobacterium sp. NS-7484 TaxID=1834161 RepID=UPI0013011651|nr:HNH endonuclease signature motif containing protein [Mycobacterium sp. NS-7484]
MNVGLVQSRDAVQTALAGHRAATASLVDVDFTTFDTAELLAIQSERERQARAQATVDHRIQSALMARTSPREIGGKSWTDVLATRMRISRREASRRVAAAADLGPRYGLTGEVLEPILPACAQALQSGTINTEHVNVIRDTLGQAQKYLNAGELVQVETDLAAAAARETPETLKAAAAKLLYLLNQDGDGPDIAAHLRGLRIGKQDADGLVHVQGWLDPEAAAYLTTVTDAWGQPGLNNPADPDPVHNPAADPVDTRESGSAATGDTPYPEDRATDDAGTESGTGANEFDSDDRTTPDIPADPQAQRDQEQAAARDTRTQSQRNHDALKVALRELLMSERLGQHGGLPVTVVVSTTLAELEAGAGIAVTGSGIWMPMSDLIRLASHSFHYLVVYDHHTAEPLYMARTKRLATKAQRLLLYNRDRGCTRPGCTAPADQCQVHHAKADWQHGGQTDAPDLALSCGPDNRLVGLGWTTSVDPNTGRVRWHPPPLMDTGQDTVNHHFHPEELLIPQEEADDR